MGNQCHLYYVSVYKDLPQMQRDIAGEREYQRLELLIICTMCMIWSMTLVSGKVLKRNMR